jgi:uncharacterized protein
MHIDWNHFTPWTSLAGGILIGGAAALFVLFNGRILGVSGILGGLLARRPADTRWRLSFLLGLILAPSAYALFAAPVVPRFDGGWPVLVIAGLLVGAGTRAASGCTSGHGVCGLAQLSPRSLVATLSFMGSGIAVVYLVRHLLA